MHSGTLDRLVLKYSMLPYSEDIIKVCCRFYEALLLDNIKIFVYDVYNNSRLCCLLGSSDFGTKLYFT
jgi:hypothetical protein